jgi:hypothetical protein
MSVGRRSGRSHLFLVRVWIEEAPTEQTEWCGKVQQVVSGETHSFRKWSMLVDLLQTMATKGVATPDGERSKVKGNDTS